jgi:hypothetical protein
MLNDSVYKTIEVIKKIDWFANCGKPLQLEPSMVGKIHQISSWKEALSHADTVRWRNIKLDGLNAISGFLDQNHRAEYQTWNEKTAELRPLVDNLFTENPIKLDKKESVKVIQITQQDIRRLLIVSSRRSRFFRPDHFLVC